LVYKRNVRVLHEIEVTESISNDKFVTGSRINEPTGYCACADIIVTKVAENGVARQK